ncbi:MAG: VapC toxin family PIN domain ribonuclease, partial [Nitrospirota bacterium]
MSYLLDTNILSETICRSPNKSVISWLDRLPGESLCVSVLTLGEIR